MNAGSERPRSQKANRHRPLSYYEKDQLIGLDVAGSGLRPTTAPSHETTTARDAASNVSSHRVFVDQRAIVTRARTQQLSRSSTEPRLDPLQRKRFVLFYCQQSEWPCQFNRRLTLLIRNDIAESIRSSSQKSRSCQPSNNNEQPGASAPPPADAIVKEGSSGLPTAVPHKPADSAGEAQTHSMDFDMSE